MNGAITAYCECGKGFEVIFRYEKKKDFEITCPYCKTKIIFKNKPYDRSITIKLKKGTTTGERNKIGTEICPDGFEYIRCVPKTLELEWNTRWLFLYNKIK